MTAKAMPRIGGSCFVRIVGPPACSHRGNLWKNVPLKVFLRCENCARGFSGFRENTEKMPSPGGRRRQREKEKKMKKMDPSGLPGGRSFPLD